MPRNQHHPTPAERDAEQSKDEFEDFVSAALKVDPKGLSGKHRKVTDRDTNRATEVDTKG